MVDYNRIHFVGNGTPSPSCHPSDGSAVSSPQGEPIVSVADTKNMQFVEAIIGRPKITFTS